MMAAAGDNLCETSGCDKEAKLQCPTCIKLEIEGSFFCSQECFKGFWNEHKAVHKSAKAKSAAGVNGISSSSSYNPWPGYSFTGKLRPYPQVNWIRASSYQLVRLIYILITDAIML